MLDPTSGSISIDGIPLSVLPRQTIRSRLIGVPQDAYLLPGPVRLNADPLKQCTDKEITLALKAVQLWEIVVKNSSPTHHSHPLDVSAFRRSLQLSAVCVSVLRNKSSSVFKWIYDSFRDLMHCEDLSMMSYY